MGAAHEKQATPAASFDPDGIKKVLLRLCAAFKTLVFFLSDVLPGEVRSPEGVSCSATEREGRGWRSSASLARSTLLISPTLPPLLDLFTSYLHLLTASRLPASRRLGEASPFLQHHISDRRRQPRPSLRGAGGERQS